MQSVSGSYLAGSVARVRKVVAKIEISWTRALAAGLGYFTIGVSTIGGSDRIRGEGNPINENSIYDFSDESTYVQSVEIDRYSDGVVFSVARAVIDIVLDNNSDRFTPGSTSPIASYIRPNRIIKASFGFTQNSVSTYLQNFVGLVVDYPKIDKVSKTISLHGLDFAYIIWDSTVKNTVMFVDSTADQIISYLLQSQGLASSLISFDVGVNVIPFAYFEKGDKLGNIISKLCEAEMARFYVDEQGLFKFKTRDSWNKPPYDSPIFTITDAMVVSEKQPDVSSIINAVEITGLPREVEQNQFLYALDSIRQIGPGATLEFFVNFDDPIYTLETPTKYGDTSFYKAGYSQDAADDSATAFIELAGYDVFSKAVKVTFRNNDPSNTIYLTQLTLWGQPAIIIGGDAGVQVRVTDDDSIDEFGEQLVKINNDFIQSSDYAQSYGNVILADRADAEDYLVLTIMGLPQLQIGDRVTRNSYQYTIVRNKIRLTMDDGMTQELTIVRRAIETYFRIGVSTISGPDIIGP
jgi:hypothetical protein